MSKKKYLKQVKTSFYFIGKRENIYIKNLKHQLDTELDTEFQGCDSYDVIVNRFGTPKELADAYFENISSTLINQKIKFKKAMLVVLAIILIAVALVTTLFIKSHIEGRNSYIDREVTEIIEE